MRVFSRQISGMPFHRLKAGARGGCLAQSLSAFTSAKSTTLGVFSSSTVEEPTWAPFSPRLSYSWLQDGGRDRQRCHDPAGGSAGGRRRDRQLPAWPPCMLAAHVELRVHTHGPVRVDLWEGQSLDADKGPGASRNVTLSRAAGIRRTAHALASLESPSSYGRYGSPRAPGPLLWH